MSASKYLASYLNDHLAGSAAVIELITHVAMTYPGTDIEEFANALRADIIVDRDELEALMASLQIKQSTTRKASGWIAQKIALLKLRFDDPAGGPLHLLEAAEATSLGIAGKRSLWSSLSIAAQTTPALQGPDYSRLMQRAAEQRERVEKVRIEAVRPALAAMR